MAPRIAPTTADEESADLLKPPPTVTTTSGERERLRFRWEAEMTQLVASQIGRLMPPGGAHVVAREVPAAQGIADVVAVRFDIDALHQRFESGVGPITSPLRVRVLNLLRSDRPVRTSTLATRLGTSATALTRSTLGPLADLGLVELHNDTVRSSGAWRPVPAHITAVELKLSKWRDALRQADNFAISADRAWLVLDAARSAAAVRESAFIASFGVGLAVIASTGELQVIAPPRGRRPERWLRALMAEQAWAAAQNEVAAVLAEGSQLVERPPAIEVDRRRDAGSGHPRKAVAKTDRLVQTIGDELAPVSDGNGGEGRRLLGSVADLVAFGEHELVRVAHLDAFGAAARLVFGLTHELLVAAPRHGAEKLWFEVRERGLIGSGYRSRDAIKPRPGGHASAESPSAPTHGEPPEPT
ncbi:hypothetical protein [Mycobacterium sp. THU-M104]|uniref:hypothetical protein n=1 Tax=Mycobacterium sp. THU-M104 TaxID=3410515 RepID=UPI003BA35259